MVQHWIHNLPDHVGNGWLLAAVVGVVVGLVLWVVGARFSRLLIGLAAVAIGGAIGIALPRLMGWSISGAGPAVALALTFGVSGYLMQRLWIGGFLGLLLASWAFLVTWVSCRAPDMMKFDSISLSVWWQSLPPNVADCLPYTCGAAAVCGLVLALVWPRLGIAAAWSVAGVSLVTALGSAAMKIGRPQWINFLPEHLGPQLSLIVALVVIGIAMQWKIAGRLAGGSSTDQPNTEGVS